MKTDLINELKEWDGTHIDYVVNLYQKSHSISSFFEDLVIICIEEQDLQKVTTWLIKHHYDNGKTLPGLLTEKLISACISVESWEAKLHILQLLPDIKLTEHSFTTMNDFVRRCLKDDNKFVKAWAYNGLYELTKYAPELKQEVEFICNRAMETESASVKSKVKKILLKLNKKSKLK